MRYRARCWQDNRTQSVREIPRRDYPTDSAPAKDLSQPRLGANTTDGGAIPDGSGNSGRPTIKPVTVKSWGCRTWLICPDETVSCRSRCAQWGLPQRSRGLDSEEWSPAGDPDDRGSAKSDAKRAKRVAVAGRSLWRRRTISCTSGKVTKQTGIAAGRAAKPGGRL
jgi:hypothetical protein